jgi:YjbE family integral membrane protein
MYTVTEFLTKALQITLIDLVLSGDNVGVIALAIRELPPKVANKARIFGIGGAVTLRIFFVMIISVLFSISWLHITFFGGILLLFITWTMIRDDTGEEKNVSAAKGFYSAVLSIILADASMSLDNVLAIASVAIKQTGSQVGMHELSLIIFGLAVCIPIIFFGSGIVAKLMIKYPIIIYICAGILVNTSFKMIFEDKWVSPYLHGSGKIIALSLGAVTIIFGLIKLFIIKKKNKKEL